MTDEPRAGVGREPMFSVYSCSPAPDCGNRLPENSLAQADHRQLHSQ